MSSTSDSSLQMIKLFESVLSDSTNNIVFVLVILDFNHSSVTALNRAPSAANCTWRSRDCLGWSLRPSFRWGCRPLGLETSAQLLKWFLVNLRLFLWARVRKVFIKTAANTLAQSILPSLCNSLPKTFFGFLVTHMVVVIFRVVSFRCWKLGSTCWLETFCFCMFASITCANVLSIWRRTNDRIAWRMISLMMKLLTLLKPTWFVRYRHHTTK